MAIIHASDADNALIDEVNKLVADVSEFLTNGWNSMLTQLDGDAGLTDTDYNATHGVTSAAIGLVRSGDRPNTVRATNDVRTGVTTNRRVTATSADAGMQVEVNAAQAALQGVNDTWAAFIVKLEADNAMSDYDPTQPNAATGLQVQRGVSTASDPSEKGGRGGAGANARNKVQETNTAQPADPDSGAVQYHVDADDSILNVINQCRADLVELRGVAAGTRGLIPVLELLDADAGVTETTYEASNTPAVATQTEDLVRAGGHPNTSNV